MKLIIGLGNLGPKYAHTRHNIGFMVLDQLTDTWQDQPRLDALVSSITLEKQPVILAKPTTMMNNSGQAVGKLAQLHKIKPEDIWVIYDELDLPLGRMKISTGTSDNGHNGSGSITQRLGHNRFWRWRIGVDTRQHREIPGLEYVLQPFLDDERDLVAKSINQAAEAVKCALGGSLELAMQRYNKASVLPAEEDPRTNSQDPNTR